MEKIDLHLHTNLSDGILSPDEVVKLSISKGCNLIAITDHDIIRDYANLSQKYSIPIINGIEFNSSITNMHILGYGIQDIEKTANYMKILKKKNEGVVIEVIKMLQNDGFNVSVNKVIDYLKDMGLSTDILDKKKLVKYLIYKHYANGVLDCYDRLIGKNQKYYIPNIKISPLQIIKLVESSGGITVLAHPATLGLNECKLERTMLELMSYGLTGIEIINSKLKFDNDIVFGLLSEKYNLLSTYGSDFHDYHTDDIGVCIDDKSFDNISKKLNLVRKI